MRIRRCPATVNEKQGFIPSLLLTSQIACFCLGPVPSEERELIALSISSLLRFRSWMRMEPSCSYCCGVNRAGSGPSSFLPNWAPGSCRERRCHLTLSLIGANWAAWQPH